MSSTDLSHDVINVLDIPLYSGNIPAASQALIDSCRNESKMNRCVSATGAHGMVFAKKNKHFSDVLKGFYLNLPDGMPGVWVGRLKGANGMMRCYGPDFFKDMLQKSAQSSIQHFFCGGNPGVAEELKKEVAKNFGNNNVAGVYCPPFLSVDKYEYTSIARLINESDANIVWIGLSTPKQEQFAYHLSKFTKVNYIIAVGAAFDFHINKVAQAPSFVQKIGMEWLFRLIMEPKRLFKRYIEVVPFFIYYNFRELFSFAKK